MKPEFNISRNLTRKESWHIYDLIGIDVPQEDQFDTAEDYEECMDCIQEEVNIWLQGYDTDTEPKLAFDHESSNRQSEILNNIQDYLKKKKVIL
jgi:hypothetical protein